jgi:hypothetical protein
VSHYAPPAPFDEEQFRRKLRNFMEFQYSTNLDVDVISKLFRITSEASSDLLLKKQQQTSTARQDLKSRGQLVEKVKRHVDESLKVLERYRKRKLPLTTRLIRPLRREFLQLRKLLARADVQFRADTVIVRGLQRSFHTDLSLAIDKYLKVIPELRSQDERNVVIAGCLFAGNLCSQKQADELLLRIPMQLSRARKRVPRVARVGFRRSSKKTVLKGPSKQIKSDRTT